HDSIRLHGSQIRHAPRPLVREVRSALRGNRLASRACGGGFFDRRGAKPMISLAPLAQRRAAPLTEGVVELVVARPDVGADAVGASAMLLSPPERQRARRFAFDPDRGRFIVARALLRQLLAARLGVRPDAVELASGARGKPALAGRLAASDLRFNV